MRYNTEVPKYTYPSYYKKLTIYKYKLISMKNFDLKDYLSKNLLLKQEDSDTLNEFFGRSKNKSQINPYKSSIQSVDDLPPGYSAGNVLPGEVEDEDDEGLWEPKNEGPGFVIPLRDSQTAGKVYDIIVKKFRSKYDKGVFDIRYARTEQDLIDRFTNLKDFPHSLHIKTNNMSKGNLQNFHNLVIDVLNDAGIEVTYYITGVDDSLFKGPSLGGAR